MARASKKNEFRKGFVRGMQDAFDRCIFLSTLEIVEAHKSIVIKASARYLSAWVEYRADIKRSEDAYTCGLNEGEQAWKDDNEMDEVAKMAKVSIATNS
jgi:hypothetical protein